MLAAAVCLLVAGNLAVVLLPSYMLNNTLNECLIDALPGTKYDGTARAKIRECRRSHPAPDNPATNTLRDQTETDKCLIKNLESTSSKIARTQIIKACRYH